MCCFMVGSTQQPWRPGVGRVRISGARGYSAIAKFNSFCPDYAGEMKRHSVLMVLEMC